MWGLGNGKRVTCTGRDRKCGAGRRLLVGPGTELEMRVEICRSRLTGALRIMLQN